MKIEAKVELSGVDRWNTDWSNNIEKENELKRLEWDMKVAIYERCGINPNDIEIEFDLID